MGGERTAASTGLHICTILNVWWGVRNKIWMPQTPSSMLHPWEKQNGSWRGSRTTSCRILPLNPIVLVAGTGITVFVFTRYCVLPFYPIFFAAPIQFEELFVCKELNMKEEHGSKSLERQGRQRSDFSVRNMWRLSSSHSIFWPSLKGSAHSTSLL